MSEKIPKPEQVLPEIERAYTEIVANDLKKLRIENDPIFEVPEILYKLAEMAYNSQVSQNQRYEKTHFKESVRIARSIKNIFEKVFNEIDGDEYKKLNSKLKLTQSKENLMKAAILHDIGKTGEEPDTYLMKDNIIMWLFNYKYGHKINTDIKIKEILEREKAEVKKSYIEQLRNCGLTPDNTMREFYDSHSLITAQILSRQYNIDQLETLSEKTNEGNVISMASRHHNTNNIKYNGIITNDSLLIELLDKFIAFQGRGENHDIEQIYKFMRSAIKQTANKKIQNELNTVFEFLKDHSDLIE